MRDKAKRRPSRASAEDNPLRFKLSILALAILGSIAYWNSFDVPLVFDDLASIQGNAALQFGESLTPALFATRPILYLTYALNYRLHGQQVWGYHLVNLVLHILNGILVLLIGIHVFRSLGVADSRAQVSAFLAAAFFLIHPVQTESVAYISSRSELLSTLFYCLAILLFVTREERRIGFTWSLVIAIPFFFGLLSKETVISLPAALLLYDFLFFSKSDWRAVYRRWPFYVTFAAGAIVAIYFFMTTVLAGSIGAGAGRLSPWHYFLTELRVIVTYVRVLLVPVGLNLDHDFRPSTSLLDPSVIGSAILLVALVGLAWRLRRSQPVVSFSIFWFFITLSPTSSFVPILDTAFEHRLYLPLVGLSLTFPVLVDYIARLARPKLRVGVAPVCAAVLVVLVVATILRNDVWGEETRLWSDVITKSPHKARPYNNLAMAYFKRGQYDRALETASLGFQNVDDSSARRSFRQLMGQLYLQLHEYEQALAAFRDTAMTEDKGQASIAYNNVGVTYTDMAKALEQKRSQMSPERYSTERQALLKEGAEAFRTSAALDKNMLFAFDSYINVMSDGGRVPELAESLRAQDKSDYRTAYGLGKLAFLSGDFAGAVEHFEDAVRLDGSQKLIFFNYAYALNQLKRRDEAIQKYLEAIHLDPLLTPAHQNVALLFMQKNDFPQAIAHFQIVLRFDPNHVSAHLNLAKVYIQLGNRAAAREHLSKVLSIAPAQEEATSLWQQLGS
jgi:tetratricopeptide (TPR) repeat protein